MTDQFIKIPTDFKSLHDLKDLVNNYDLVSRLSNLLNNYQKAHIDSYLMTMDEVLEYIPEKDHESYKIYVSGRRIDDYVSRPSKPKDLAFKLAFALCSEKNYNYSSDDFDFKITDKAKNEAVFIVNTLKKQIDCIYFFCKLDFHNNSRNEYGKVEYEINEEKILSVKVHFSFTDHQQVGGAQIWCGTGHTYFRGGQQVPYTREGYEVYEFDTKTNQYLGFAGTTITTPERKWHKEKSRYY